jgi:mycothione reductase
VADIAHFDLAIIGSGSGNSLVTEAYADKQVAIVERGIFGGTCLNVGCIPTKMYVYTADVALMAADSSRYGVDTLLDGVRWADLRDRVFTRIDAISQGGHDYRANAANTTVFDGHGRFVGPRTMEVSTGEAFTADQIVIATGSHSAVPEVISRSGVPYHTSDTVMRIDDLPNRLLIIGGGYISAEFAHVFSALTSEVTIVVRGPAMLRQLDEELSHAFTDQAVKQWDVRLGVEVIAATDHGGEIHLELSDGSSVIGDLLLVATGRHPNTADLGLDTVGVQTHPDGRVRTDPYGRTNVAGVWALGDVSSEFQLKHVSNHEARAVAHNLTHPQDLRAFDHRYVPSAVFSHPQLASVGLTEEQAETHGYHYVTATQAYGDTAYGWAMEDATGICKLIADADSGLLLGAHLMGPQASNLIQPLIQALSFGQRVVDLARGQYWIHPAMMEVVENALLKLDLS